MNIVMIATQFRPSMRSMRTACPIRLEELFVRLTGEDNAAAGKGVNA
ncbi:MAG TPA: hypothetical protein VGH80_02970 [Xanthomonadaceae bacterium]|jgi:hypothetical protein